jgi:hypothetical protein
MEENKLKVVYETWFGSHAYGTNRPDSDEDFRGICIAPLETYFGVLSNFEELEQKVPDRVLWNITKFMKMAMNSNPSTFEILFCDENSIIKMNPSGEKLRNHRDLFLSKQVSKSYMGYAFSQFNRLKRHKAWLINPPKNQPERADFGLPENRKVISADEQGAFIYVLNAILKGTVEELKLSDSTLEELKNVNTIGLLQSANIVDPMYWKQVQEITGASDNFIDYMSRERAYKNSMSQWTSYVEWRTNRNGKRAELEKKYGYDTKFAQNLIRLIRMGEEILTGKGVIVKRPDAEDLKAIAHGSMSFEELEAYVIEKEQTLKNLELTTTLPKSIHRVKLNELCQEILSNELYTDIAVHALPL